MISFKKFTMREFVWLFAFAISVGLILGSYQYHYFDPNIVLRRKATSLATYPWVFIHVSSGTIWLLSGFLQFTGWFLKDLRKHRINGYIYIVSSLISTISLMIINFKLGDRSPFGAGSYPGSIYSLICIVAAWIFIKKKNLEFHRAWMLRSMVPAMVMPLDRFKYSLVNTFGMPAFDIDILKIIALVTVELVIFRVLDFDLIPSKEKWIRVPGTLLLASVCLVALVLTMYLEYSYVNILKIW